MIGLRTASTSAGRSLAPTSPPWRRKSSSSLISIPPAELHGSAELSTAPSSSLHPGRTSAELRPRTTPLSPNSAHSELQPRTAPLSSSSSHSELQLPSSAPHASTIEPYSGLPRRRAPYSGGCCGLAMAKRELSSTLKNLKFMQRTSQREEKPVERKRDTCGAIQPSSSTAHNSTSPTPTRTMAAAPPPSPKFDFALSRTRLEAPMGESND